MSCNKVVRRKRKKGAEKTQSTSNKEEGNKGAGKTRTSFIKEAKEKEVVE